MLPVPHHIIEHLKCTICNGYLSSKPLMIKPESNQLCGKCFMIIPSEEKEKCIRQIALESLASVFMFPCRYRNQGCTFTFPWDHERNHEESCMYRYKTPYRNSTGSEYFKHQVLLRNSANYDINQNIYFEDQHSPTYLNLQKTLQSQKTSELQNSINCSIEVGVKHNPEVVIEEHLYDSLTPLLQNGSTQQHCFNCNAIIGEQIFQCSLGHISCGSCKGSMCMICVNIFEKESKTSCKYNHSGCKEMLKHDEINKHQANCCYRSSQCLFENCKYKNIMALLPMHFKECHPDKVLFSCELTKTFYNRDETLVFICYDKVFKFVYYFYKSFVEFFVTFVGSSEEAANYYYKISVQTEEDFITRKSKCASWNDSMLEKGITFDRRSIVDTSKKKFSFLVELTIHKSDK